jgi:hypothetical protein
VLEVVHTLIAFPHAAMNCPFLEQQTLDHARAPGATCAVQLLPVFVVIYIDKPELAAIAIDPSEEHAMVLNIAPDTNKLRVHD